jgi:AcrR family transcriptional regulator
MIDPTGEKMARRTRRDWLFAGFEILGSQGRDGLKLEALCERLAVTRGSFYHHFRDFADYRAQLLEMYRQEGTLRIIEMVEQEATPRAKLARLLELIVELTGARFENPEPAIRAWALQDGEVQVVQRAIDERRTAYVMALLEAMGAPPERARLLADYLYALLVGCEQMQPPVQGQRLRSMFDEYLRLIDNHLHPEEP